MYWWKADFFDIEPLIYSLPLKTFSLLCYLTNAITADSADWGGRIVTGGGLAEGLSAPLCGSLWLLRIPLSPLPVFSIRGDADAGWCGCTSNLSGGGRASEGLSLFLRLRGRLPLFSGPPLALFPFAYTHRSTTLSRETLGFSWKKPRNMSIFAVWRVYNERCELVSNLN